MQFWDEYGRFISQSDLEVLFLPLKEGSKGHHRFGRILKDPDLVPITLIKDPILQMFSLLTETEVQRDLSSPTTMIDS